MSELLPCPFCGGEAHTIEPARYGKSWGVRCECGAFLGFEYTEAEAIAAWNSRVPIEYEGWFYLPKPKEGIVDYGEPEITRIENGYKVRQIADIVDEAACKWGEELGEYVMQRICEIWNSRAERTCKRFWTGAEMICSECAHQLNDATANYCPNCGARRVGE